LADKAFVNTSISTNTANFLGTYNLISDLELSYSDSEPYEPSTADIITAIGGLNLSPTKNDYIFVEFPDDPNREGVSSKFDRYKYNGSS
jgi:hypothetical protein